MSEIDNPKRVKRKAIIVRLQERQNLDDMAFIMKTVQGRRVMNDLLKRCGVGRLSFSGPGQAEQTAFYEGQRNIGNYYWALLTKNFKNEWLLMTEEAEKKEEETKNGGRIDDATENGRTGGDNDPNGEGA